MVNGTDSRKRPGHIAATHSISCRSAHRRNDFTCKLAEVHMNIVMAKGHLEEIPGAKKNEPAPGLRCGNTLRRKTGSRIRRKRVTPQAGEQAQIAMFHDGDDTSPLPWEIQPSGKRSALRPCAMLVNSWTAAVGSIHGRTRDAPASDGKERSFPCRTASRSFWSPTSGGYPGPGSESAWICSPYTAWARS